ncbi:MAG TPA: NAD(P)-binding domain-containing protein [Kofleriaceae bacterium]|nr:NAD(P)-binding domain-containing protein [Kofleriaceae bacterium]
MKIGVLGTGSVGQTIAAKLAELGHDVMVGTRDPAATLARTEPDRFGNPPLKTWLAGRERVELGTFAQAAARGELVVNATSGDVSLEVLRAAGGDHLAGKVLVDIANPLDFSRGFPPTLSVCNTDSLAEQIQRAVPAARVVKTLNTVNATLMVEPGRLAGGDHTMFMCGDDAAAKATVAELLESFGWRDVVDLGALSNARATEMLLPIWVRLFGHLKTPAFNFKLVR